jgi:hypothetical protein
MTTDPDDLTSNPNDPGPNGSAVITDAEAPKGGLPKWAKILIGVVIVGIIGIAASFLGILFFMKNLAENAKDPVYITRTAQKMADFGDLPPGYEFTGGLDMMGIQMVMISHEKTNQTLSIASYPKKDKDPHVTIEKLISSGVTTPNQTAKIQDIQQRGEIPVAGTTMPYAIGKVTDVRGRAFEGMFGCVVSPTKDRTLLIYGIQPLGTKYDMATTEAVLKTIKSF